VGGVGPRFLLEAGFLIALAVGLGIAELSAGVIVGVMALAWLLVCLLELTIWADRPRPADVRNTPQEPDEATPAETVEPAAVTEIREAEPATRRGRFWRRRAAS
jgi:hypothetical protein